MKNGLVFNHHSIPFSDRYVAEKNIPEFMKICSSARTQAKMDTILIDESIDSSWFRVELADGYCLGDWFNQNRNSVDFKDIIRAFRSILTNSPLFKTEDIGGDLDLFDVKEKSTKQCYSALRAAVWYNRLLCSFPSRPPWNSNPLDVIIEKCDQDADLISNNEKLINLVTIEDWNSVKDDVIKARQKSIKSGKDLLVYCNEEYSKLCFCGDSTSQLQSWSHEDTILNQAKKCFASLNAYGEAMDRGDVQGYTSQKLKAHGFPHDVSGESSAVSNNPKKRNERMFYLPDGRKEYFENHAKLARGFRLHFFPDSQTGITYIGYLGKHLTL